MKHRPGTIDRQLIGRPELRQKVEEAATDYGLTTDEFVQCLAELGVQAHRSAASRYRVKLRPRRHGPVSPLLAALIAHLFRMTRGQQQQQARQWGVKVVE